MADAAPDDVHKALMERALEELEPLRGRISVLLLPEASPGTARVSTNARDRSFLKFIDMELSPILAVLRHQLEVKEQGVVFPTMTNRLDLEFLLEVISKLAGDIGRLLDRYERPPPCHAVLLHRAARCCRRRTTNADPWEIVDITNWLAFVTQHPLMNKHHLLVGDDTASTSNIRPPYWLKLLLLYMVSMFPQGYKFDKNRLIWKWASERLTKEFDWFRNVRKAEGCFSRLVDSEVIIQAANYGHKPAAEAEDCRWQVNPDMLQFLASESADKCFVCTSGMLNSAAAAGGDSDSTEILRRLSLHQPVPELPKLLETMDLSHTRSLAVSGAVDGIPLGKFIYLTVLDLEGWENLKDEDLPQQICSTMFLLRCLIVSNTGVTRLPPEIKELRYLEALDVSHTKISELPPEACQLERLWTLDLRSTQVRQLPEQIVKLIFLRDLLVGGDAKIPEGIVHIPYLRTLATVDLSEWSASSVEALGGFKKLGPLRMVSALEVLAITWSFHQCADGRYQKALRASIEEWEYLRSLTIHCGLGCSMEFLGSLDSPPKNLEKFKVTTGRFVTVPQWIKGLEPLSFLEITVCKLGTDDLKILGELPRLQRLVLGLDFLPGEAIRSERGFRQLRTFSVHCLVPWLTFGDGTMPKLTYLDLEIICSVPPNQDIVLSGISNLEKLREVVLGHNEWYSDSSSVKKTVEVVKNAVAEHPNPIKLVINGTQHGVQAEAVDEETARKTTTEIQKETEIEGEIESENPDAVTRFCDTIPHVLLQRRGKHVSFLSYLQSRTK